MSTFREPAWLTGKADQRLAEMKAHLGEQVASGYDHILTSLSEPSGGDTARWERTCDGCGTFVPYGEQGFSTGMVRRVLGSAPVVMVYGICNGCLP